MIDLVEQQKMALNSLCRKHSVRRLELFGSAATGAFDAGRSDLDFLAKFDDLLPARYADAYFSLKQELEVLFGRRVDLITASNLDNPYFRQRVLAESQRVYAR
jgi:predicted nucleotidyltransferase